MTAVDLDPMFVKALKLLHSKAKDSTAQLKAMLDDAIAQRKGLKVISSQSSHSDFEKAISGKSKNEDEPKRREAEKRSSDKSSKDPSEPDVKKSKVDSSKSRSKEEKEAREKEKERDRMKKEKEKRERDEKEAQRQKDKAERERKEKEASAMKAVESDLVVLSDDEGAASQVDAGDFAMEMGIACVVCRQFDVSSGNQLVECQECHNLYHQECHKPPVTEEEISDPRFVWYCSRCARSLKKMVAQKPVKPKPSLTTPSISKEPLVPLSKASKPDASSSTQAFRRIDPKSIVTPKETSSLNTTAKPMVGLAGLAANLAKPRSESKSSSSGRKSDPKGDSSKSGKSDSKCGYKSDSSSKSSGKSSKDDRDRDRKSESGHKSSRHDDTSSSKSSSSSSHSKEDKKSEQSSKSSSSDHKWERSDSKNASGDYKWDKSDSKKSPAHHESSKSESSSMKSSSSTSSAPTTPTTADSSSLSSKGASNSASSSSNKQAVANLSMVTANKRIQMMKKKAQAKPQDKKMHIK